MKQMIVIRKDLKMRLGKSVAQGAHGCMKATLENLDHPNVKEWIKEKFTKVVVSVDSEEELFEVFQAAKDAGLITALIKDAGFTEFNEPTYTCCAIGPNNSDEIDEITGHLKLL